MVNSTLTSISVYVLVVVSDPKVPEDGCLVEIVEEDHVLDSVGAQVLPDPHRAEVVEGERLGDVVDDRLDRDHLGSLVELDHLARQDVAHSRVEPDQVARLKLTGQHHPDAPV